MISGHINTMVFLVLITNMVTCYNSHNENAKVHTLMNRTSLELFNNILVFNEKQINII